MLFLRYCYIAGDARVGKSSFIETYITARFPEQVQRVADPYTELVKIDISHTLRYSLWDTDAREDKSGERWSSTAALMRKLLYRDVNIALICFDVCNRESFLNCVLWINKLKRMSTLLPLMQALSSPYMCYMTSSGQCPGVPYIVVGLKTDLRDNPPKVDEPDRTKSRRKSSAASVAKAKSLEDIGEGKIAGAKPDPVSIQPRQGTADDKKNANNSGETSEEMITPRRVVATVSAKLMDTVCAQIAEGRVIQSIKDSTPKETGPSPEARRLSESKTEISDLAGPRLRSMTDDTSKVHPETDISVLTMESSAIKPHKKGRRFSEHRRVSSAGSRAKGARRMSTPNERKYSFKNVEESKNSIVPEQLPPPVILKRGVSILEGNVTTAEGEQLCRDSKAFRYMECSSSQVKGVHDVIMETIYVLQERNNKSSAVCAIQ